MLLRALIRHFTGVGAGCPALTALKDAERTKTLLVLGCGVVERLACTHVRRLRDSILNIPERMGHLLFGIDCPQQFKWNPLHMPIQQAYIGAVVVNGGPAVVEGHIGVLRHRVRHAVLIQIQCKIIRRLNRRIDIVINGVHEHHGVSTATDAGLLQRRGDVAIIKGSAQGRPKSAEMRANPTIPVCCWDGSGGFAKRQRARTAAGTFPQLVEENCGFVEDDIRRRLLGDIGRQLGMPEGLGVIAGGFSEERDLIPVVVGVHLVGQIPVPHVGTAFDRLSGGFGFRQRRQ